MLSLPIEASFRTLSTEIAGCTQCAAILRLRIEPFQDMQRAFYGLGFGIDGFSARAAAEGECLERTTWFAGGLWTPVYFNKDVIIPEEAKLFLSQEHIEAIERNDIPAISVNDWDGNQTWIPSTAVFHFPFIAPHLSIHSVTTGWAYHSILEQAIIKSYLEVIERDLICLFWYCRLSHYLKQIKDDDVRKCILSFGLAGKTIPEAFQLNVLVPDRFGGKACFTLITYCSQEKPYLTIGSTIKRDPLDSLQSALGEFLMLRSNQYEQLLCDEKEEEDGPFNFKTHVIRASNKAFARDRTINLLKDIERLDAETEPRLNYSDKKYWIAAFNPPPIGCRGFVTKVWVDGCQPMVPAGLPCGLVERWKDDWYVSKEEWEANRWHPFP